MANSLIDDMFAENSQFNSGNNNPKSKKGGKKGLLLLLVLLIIVAVVAVIFMMNLSSQKIVVSGKTEFITYLSQNPMEEIMDTSTLKSVFETLVNNSSESNTDITLITNIEGVEALADFKADLNTKYDSNNSRGLVDINLDYSDNGIFNMQALITGKSVALKADEIVTKYVGYKYENIASIVNDFSSENTGIDGMSYINSNENEFVNLAEVTLDTDEFYSTVYEDENVELNNTIGDIMDTIQLFDYTYLLESFTPEFIQAELAKYSQVISTLEDSKFSSKEVALERDSGNINTVAYILTLNEDELIKLETKMLEELKNDTELFSILLTALEPTGIELDESTIKLFIDQIINSAYEIQGDTSKIYTFTIYVADSKVVKTTIDTETISFDIDYILNGNNNSCVLTILEKESNSGMRIEAGRTSNDVSEQIDIAASVIENNEVVNQISAYIMVQGITSQTEMTIDMNLSYTDTVNELGINIATDVEFKDIEVEDLTSDNCLFLDDLTEEDRKIVIDSIEARSLEVLEEKKKQITLINSNTGSSVVEGQPDNEDDEEQKKEEAKEKLINAVANEMYIAEQNGEEYTVNDVADLQMEDAELEVSVENEVATVIIDGYTFTINAAFELSE